MNYRWRKLNQYTDSEVSTLAERTKAPEIIARMLLQRNLSDLADARSFLRPDLTDIHDPFLMKDMDRAVDRVSDALETGEKIMIYGDYDVDGTTSVATVYTFLRKYSDQLYPYIPDRYKEGYGISTIGIDVAEKLGCSLIIALDCGIKAIDKVEYAREKGIDFIICDHHRPGAEIPNAHAVLDPKRSDCEYPYKELCGCGVGFKLIQGLTQKQGLDREHLFGLLDLVAVAIGADIVPITGENRILAYHGLQRINSKPRAGLAACIELAGRKPGSLTIEDVVFQIAPRINAAGRIEHGKIAVDMLSEPEMEKALEIAGRVQKHNEDRRKLDRNITREALQMIESEGLLEKKSTVLFHEEWHKGVIGIVASKLIEKHYRPTVVFTESNGVLAGSARSVSGFDIYNALDECTDILEQFGGHSFAAGMTLRKDRFDAFREKFEEVVSSQIEEHMLTPEIVVDQEISISDINRELWKWLSWFAPYGPGNQNPTFVSTNLNDSGYAKGVGADSAHLKMRVVDPTNGVAVDAIGFGLGDKLNLVQDDKRFHVAYHIGINEWRGEKKFQLMVKDIKSAE
jgi:single-stranded-DNA-specific exonuclease